MDAEDEEKGKPLGDGLAEVECVLQVRGSGRKREAEVRWAGEQDDGTPWPDDWLPLGNLVASARRDAMQLFQAKRRRKAPAKWEPGRAVVAAARKAAAAVAEREEAARQRETAEQQARERAARRGAKRERSEEAGGAAQASARAYDLRRRRESE